MERAPGRSRPVGQVEQPQQRRGRQQPHDGAQHDVEHLRVGEDESRVDPAARGHQHAHAPAETGSKVREAGAQACVKGPGNHASHDDSEDEVDVQLVDLVLAAHHIVGAEVEDPVGPQGCGRAVVQVEEPDGAVDQGEPQGQQCVDRAHGQAIEGELQRLLRGLADLPADIPHSQGKESGVEKAARRLQPCRQASVHATPRNRWRRRGDTPSGPVYVLLRPVSRRRGNRDADRPQLATQLRRQETGSSSLLSRGESQGPVALVLIRPFAYGQDLYHEVAETDNLAVLIEAVAIANGAGPRYVVEAVRKASAS